MTRPAVTVTTDTAVEQAAELMERLRIHRLVVIDADGETPIGLLSLTDLVRVMADRGTAQRALSDPSIISDDADRDDWLVE